MFSAGVWRRLSSCHHRSDLSQTLSWAPHFPQSGVQSCQQPRGTFLHWVPSLLLRTDTASFSPCSCRPAMGNAFPWPWPPDELLFLCQSPAQMSPPHDAFAHLPQAEWLLPPLCSCSHLAAPVQYLRLLCIYLSKFVSSTRLWVQGLRNPIWLFPVTPAHSPTPSPL